MKSIRHFTLVISLTIIVGLLSACRTPSATGLPPSSPAETPAVSPAAPVTPPASLVPPKPMPPYPIKSTDAPSKISYSLGEQIRVDFAWQNTIDEPVTVKPFPFAIDITDADRKPIRSLVGGDGGYAIKPGEVLRHSITWDQRNNSGQAVAPGAYFLSVNNTVSSPKTGVASGYAPLKLLVQFPEGAAMDNTIRPSQAIALEDDSRLVLDELILTALGAKARASLIPVSYLGPTTDRERASFHTTLDGAAARYRVDGRQWSSLRVPIIGVLKESIAIEWDLINPVPRDAKVLELAVQAMTFTYSPNNRLDRRVWEGPFEFRIPLQ